MCSREECFDSGPNDFLLDRFVLDGAFEHLVDVAPGHVYNHPAGLHLLLIKMVFICAFSCGNKPRKIVKSKPKKMSDFRKADPKFVDFEPSTCAEAIDLFVRHRNLGMQTHLYPECFIRCSRALPDPELDKFYRWIVCPTGDVAKGGEGPTLVDQQLEEERF